MLKLQLQSKGFFRTITNTLFDKTILYIIFWIVLNIKYEKKSLRLNNLSYVKYWKTNKKNFYSNASFCHKIVFRTRLFTKKIKSDAKNNFFISKCNLHGNVYRRIYQQFRVLRFHSDDKLFRHSFVW